MMNRPRIAIAIGCLNIITYCTVVVMVLDNLKYDRYSLYDYQLEDDTYKSYELREKAQSYREIYYTIYAIVCFLMMLLSALLIWGIVKERSGMMIPWLLGSSVILIYSSTETLDDIFLKSSFRDVGNTFIFFGILFLVFAFQIFCLVLIYGVYKNLEFESFLQKYHQQAREASSEYMKELIADDNIGEEEQTGEKSCTRRVKKNK
ncbi:uncharacterized protein LOC142221074 isoform X1 [Haematobia irritans]|uniref:uncharacterized protein LOC142221074 isoform X1 n=1 Tax=Haematobia irritans TaxID=7368 RepID=UPI003F4F96D0